MLDVVKKHIQESTLAENLDQLKELQNEINKGLLTVGLYRNEVIFLKKEILRKQEKKMFII
jgi:phosphoenolpyruvate-protein kinase (PTS system EI component)